MELAYQVDGRFVTIGIDNVDGRVTVTVDGRPLSVDSFRIRDRYVLLTIDGQRRRLLYARDGDHLHVAVGGRNHAFVRAEDVEGGGSQETGVFHPEVISPMPGKVLDVLVTAGDQVEADQPLLLLEAMKMEQTVRAPAASKVARVAVQAGAMVGPGELLLVLEALADD